MKKQQHTPAEAQGAGTEKFKAFRLNDIGFTDLDGNRIKLAFDQKEFGNLLFANATSIELDTVAKSIHSMGHSQVTNEDLRQIEAIVTHVSNYNHRVKTAVSEYVNNLIGGK